MANIYEQLHDDMEFNLYESPTKTDLEIARSNGLSYDNVYQRINRQGYTVLEAITLKKGAKRGRKNLDAYERWRGVCEANGIGFKTFESRLKQGKSEEVAATTKLHEPVKKLTDGNLDFRGLYEKWEETIKVNGIKYKTFQLRILRGWDAETAATKTPRQYKG